MRTTRIVPTLRVLVALSVLSAAALAQSPYPSFTETPAITAHPQNTNGVPHPSPQGRVRTDTAPFIKMATAIGDDYFDGRDSRERVQRHLRIARQAGVQYLRFGFSWNGVEPEHGKYNFGFWDMLVQEAGRAGIELIPYVAYTPEWAARTEQEFWKQPPKAPALYANIMRTLAQRYRGKIRTWELWNEPDNLEYWTGSADEFATTMIAAAQAVREVAPEARLVLGGMTQGAGEFFQKLIRDYHLDRYVDVLAIHAYPESWHEQRAEAVFQQIMPEMEKAAQQSGRALWLNEMGYADYRFAPNKASLYGTSTFYNYEHTPRYAADFLFKSYTMALASGDVSLAGWYRIDDFVENDPRMPSDKVHHHLGLTDVRGKPKPAFFALKFFNTLFTGPTRTVCSQQGPVTCPMRNTNGTPQAVVNLFQRTNSTLVLTAWLRSSTYSEVSKHTGMEQDRRRERVNLQLPCTAQTVRTFNALGTPLSTHRPNSSTLRDVPLSGDRVFIAEVSCAPGTEASKPEPRIKAD